jgi:anti-anti-sigma factor
VPVKGSASTRLVWPITVVENRRADVLVIAPSGRMGTVSSGEVIEAVVKAVKAGERRMVLDLAGVDYISSAGLLALQALAGRMHVAGGTLVLCGLVEAVRLTFDLAGVLDDFTLEDTVSEAVARASGETRPQPGAGTIS